MCSLGGGRGTRPTTLPRSLLVLLGLGLPLYWWVLCSLTTLWLCWWGVKPGGAGVGSHWAGQQRSNILLSCIDILDKNVDIILLFCCSFIFLFCCLWRLVLQLFLSEEWFLELNAMVLVRLASLIDIVVLFWLAMLVKRAQMPLVSIESLFCSVYIFFCSCWWGLWTFDAGCGTMCCCRFSVTVLLLLLCLFLFEEEGGS